MTRSDQSHHCLYIKEAAVLWGRICLGDGSGLVNTDTPLIISPEYSWLACSRAGGLRLLHSRSSFKLSKITPDAGFLFSLSGFSPKTSSSHPRFHPILTSAPSSLSSPLPLPPLPSSHLFSPSPSLPPSPSDLCRSRLRPGDAGLLTGPPSAAAACWAPCLQTWTRSERSDMLTMNLEGLEMIAVLVLVVLFVKVLDRFGLLAASYDGKEALMSGRLFFLAGGGRPLVAEAASGSERGSIRLLPPVTDWRFIRKTWAPRGSPAANWLRVTHAKQIDNPA